MATKKFISPGPSMATIANTSTKKGKAMKISTRRIRIVSSQHPDDRPHHDRHSGAAHADQQIDPPTIEQAAPDITPKRRIGAEQMPWGKGRSTRVEEVLVGRVIRGQQRRGQT